MTYLCFANLGQHVFFLLDELVASLAQVGVTLNFKKTKIFTTQAKHPQQLQARGGVTMDVLCIELVRVFAPCAQNVPATRRPGIDWSWSCFTGIQYNSVNIDWSTWGVRNKTPIFWYNYSTTPVACCAAGHRAISSKNSAILTWHSEKKTSFEPTSGHRLVTPLAWYPAWLECTGYKIC